MKLFKHADKRIVSSGLAIALGATVMYTVLGSYATIWAEIKGIFGYVSSVVWGLVLAYVMRPFAAFVERLLPKKFSQKAKAHIGGVCALILLIVLIAVFFYLLLPQLISSIKGFMNHFDEYLESLKKTLREYLERIQVVEIDVDKTIGTSNELLKTLGKWLSGNVDIIMDWVVQMSSRIVNFIIIITMATYALLDRHNLRTGSEKLEKALMGEARTEKINAVIKRGDALMMRFLSSNLMDALIIGELHIPGHSVRAIPADTGRDTGHNQLYPDIRSNHRRRGRRHHSAVDQTHTAAGLHHIHGDTPADRRQRDKAPAVRRLHGPEPLLGAGGHSGGRQHVRHHGHDSRRAAGGADLQPDKGVRGPQKRGDAPGDHPAGKAQVFPEEKEKRELTYGNDVKRDCRGSPF